MLTKTLIIEGQGINSIRDRISGTFSQEGFEIKSGVEEQNRIDFMISRLGYTGVVTIERNAANRSITVFTVEGMDNRINKKNYSSRMNIYLLFLAFMIGAPLLFIAFVVLRNPVLYVMLVMAGILIYYNIKKYYYNTKYFYYF